MRRIWRGFAILWLAGVAQAAAPPIDRHALVTRHNPSFTRPDPAAPLMVGNGSIGFTADITGLQTFPAQYSPLTPLFTQAQWAWHSFPNPQGYQLSDALVPIQTPRGTRRYPALSSWEQAQSPPIRWLRENPHRFNLARLGLYLLRADGSEASFTDLRETRQTLDLWTGRLASHFVLDGAAVEVETSVHPDRDLILVRLRGAGLARQRLGIDLRFPGVAATLNPDPSDWTNPHTHRTRELARSAQGLRLERQLDDTHYFVQLHADHRLAIGSPGPHHYRLLAPGSEQLTLQVEFSRRPAARLPGVAAARAAVARAWRQYWTQGGMVEFAGSRDPRAPELERRIVLSQYLSALNGAGELPPQEEGLFSNSWNGKSHLEMHVWHAAHFALWGRPQRLARSMDWYLRHLDAARQRALDYGVQGAWWPKMVGPDGRESPSTINPFIMWQQPHPIYLAELLYRATPDQATLRRYAPLVFASADLLASWPVPDPATGRYQLGPPLIPAQENFPAASTFNPTFEIEYWRFGLQTAQRWRQRLGLAPQPQWQRVLERLPTLPARGGLYLAAESQPDLWERARSPACQPRAAPQCPNRDHPSLLAALGYLPGQGVDRPTMARTLHAVLAHWDLRQTWGWDWPLMAMTATRLGRSHQAVDLLFTDQKNFQFGATGMTPRVHVVDDDAPHAAGLSVDGPGYRRAAQTYFPSNGGLLLAIALMVAGEDAGPALPGFPQDGSWVVRSEGLLPLP